MNRRRKYKTFYWYRKTERGLPYNPESKIGRLGKPRVVS